MIQSKEKRLHIRASTEQLERLVLASELLETSMSEFVRQTIDEKLEKLAKRYPELVKRAA